MKTRDVQIVNEEHDKAWSPTSSAHMTISWARFSILWLQVVCTGYKKLIQNNRMYWIECYFISRCRWDNKNGSHIVKLNQICIDHTGKYWHFAFHVLNKKPVHWLYKSLNNSRILFISACSKLSALTPATYFHLVSVKRTENNPRDT